MNVVHYKAGMDCDGNVAIIPVAYDQLQTMPVAIAPSHPAIAPIAAKPEPKPEPVRGIPIPIIVIGGLLCFLVLNPGNSGEQSVSELQTQNEYLRQRVNQLEYQLMGVYSAQ